MGAAARRIETISRSSELILPDVRVDVSGVETFVAESIQSALPITGRASLGVKDGDIELTATVRNDSDQTLQHVTLLIGSFAAEIGDMAPGEEKSITEVVGTVRQFWCDFVSFNWVWFPVDAKC